MAQQGKYFIKTARSYYKYAKLLIQVQDEDLLSSILSQGDKIMGKYPQWPQQWQCEFIKAYDIHVMLLHNFDKLKPEKRKE